MPAPLNYFTIINSIRFSEQKLSDWLHSLNRDLCILYGRQILLASDHILYKVIDRVLKIGILATIISKNWVHGKLCNMFFQRLKKVQLALNLFFIDTWVLSHKN